jgi:uncharacterized protein (DUF1800 family)
VPPVVVPPVVVPPVVVPPVVVPPVVKPPVVTPPPPAVLPSQAQAARFLNQVSFGATTGEIDTVASIGYNNWIDAQFAQPIKLHESHVAAQTALLPANAFISDLQFSKTFWEQAITGNDQLRQRISYALSQIFVVSSMDNGVGEHGREMASYYDVLARNAFGNYRQLLEQVSLHPAMGLYLSALRNTKESGTRVPDENYAREIMQLFSIGLLELNADGTPKTSAGKFIETYDHDSVAGMAKVFTGWSWGGPNKSDTSFFSSQNAERFWLPMQSYPKWHSVSEKKFLGVSIPAQSAANPEASLKTALDTLYNHPNVGPFIGKQLIQRLVSSNPSAQYVARVSAAFANNGLGVRGDMKAVIKAILLDPEARNYDSNNQSAGKLREPVLRLSHWMRSFSAKAGSDGFNLARLDDPLAQLAQSPLRSPSVFNFYRPGYVPPNTGIAKAGLVAPEFQITTEVSVIGYLNFMRNVIPNGINGVKADYGNILTLADTPAALVDRIDLLLMSQQMSDTLRNQILAAVNSLSIPANSPAAATLARKNRVYLSIFLTMASPEYLVQK